MAMKPSIARLRALSDQELIAEHDRIAQDTQIGTGFYLEELGRRDMARQTASIRRLTGVIAWLTFVVTILTALSLAVVAADKGWPSIAVEVTAPTMETLSSALSIVVGIIVLAATYWQWVRVSYDGKTKLYRWVKWGLLPFCIIALLGALVLLVLGQLR